MFALWIFDAGWHEHEIFNDEPAAYAEGAALVQTGLASEYYIKLVHRENHWI